MDIVFVSILAGKTVRYFSILINKMDVNPFEYFALSRASDASN